MIAWLTLAFILIASPALAVVQNCTVAWNARSEADLAGYKVLWGTSSGVYTNTVTLGTQTSTTCAALGITTIGTKFLVVRAFDNLSQESGNSTQVSFTLADVAAPPTDPTITSFSPSSGVVGTVVTINGTNFSSTLSNNIVKFNGVTATLSSGTTTQLRAIVPALATTGKISVTVGSATAQSSATFTVSTLPPSSIYDAATDFATVQGAVWTYLDHTRTAMTYGGAPGWTGPQAYQWIWLESGDLVMHPGASLGTSILRWTAPAAGLWNISVTTGDGDSSCGNGVIVSVVHNLSTTLYTRTIANGGGEVTEAINQTVALGDTIEFIVDANSDYGCDSTVVNATLSTTVDPGPDPGPDPEPEPEPEPTTLVIQSLTTPLTSFALDSSAVLTVRVSPTPAVNTTVTISSGSQTIVTTPSTVVIPAGAPNANFTVHGASAGSTFVTASLNNSTATLLLTVVPTSSLLSVDLLSPADLAVLDSSTKFVILRWQPIHAALRYELRVRDDTISTDNTHPICAGYRICETNLIVTSYRLLLKPGHSYTWTVKWIDQAGNTSSESSRRVAVRLNE